MEFANAGMLHRGNRVLFERAIATLPTDDPVVEIGVWAGLSTNVLTHLLVRHRRSNRLICTDPWIFEGEGAETLQPSDVRFVDYRELVRGQFVQNVRFWSRGRLPEAVQLSSDDFFVAWGKSERVPGVLGGEVQLGGPIAMAFIDGAHEYKQAKRDFENVDRMLVSNGFILFDDSDEFGAFPQLYKLVRQILAVGGYEHIGENPHHLLRKL